MTELKQWRVVYGYQRGLTKGSGAAFVIAADEAGAREQFEKDMPGAKLEWLKEEPVDVGAIYERRPRLALVEQPKDDGVHTYPGLNASVALLADHLACTKPAPKPAPSSGMQCLRTPLGAPAAAPVEGCWCATCSAVRAVAAVML